MPTKTSDLCDEHADVQACTAEFRGWGRRRHFAGPIRTVRANGDIVPVTFGDATFVPGRWVVADEDGVVVLPEGMTDAK